jgi:hypothetical protein
LDRQSHSGGRRSPVFDEQNGMLHLNPRRHRRPMSTRDDEYSSRE